MSNKACFSITIVLVLFLSIIGCEDEKIEISDKWVKKSNFPAEPRASAATFSIGNKGYIVTGWKDGYKKDVWMYNPETDQWTEQAEFPGIGRFRAIAFSIANFGYIGLGSRYNELNDTTSYFKDLWEFDPERNQWTAKASFPGNPREHASVFIINNKAYIGTGKDTSGYYNDFWRFTPQTGTLNGEWQQISNLPATPRANCVAFTINNCGYIGMGVTKNQKVLDDFWKYSPDEKQWLQVASLFQAPREGAIAFATDSSAFIGTGWYNGKVYGQFWKYDPRYDFWSQADNFPGIARTNALLIQAKGKAYVGIGFAANDWWEYTP